VSSQLGNLLVKNTMRHVFGSERRWDFVNLGANMENDRFSTPDILHKTLDVTPNLTEFDAISVPDENEFFLLPRDPTQI
jgi:hypothetical protein